MIRMPVSKVMPLAELAGLVPDGASVALGGSFLHRGPFAFVRELIRQGRSGLEIVKQSPGYDIDILCRARSVAPGARRHRRHGGPPRSRAGLPPRGGATAD